MALTLTECAITGCGSEVAHQNLCYYHYRVRLGIGVYGKRGVERTREHLRRLRDLGWPWSAIAEQTGLSALGVRRIPGRSWVRSETERLVCAVPLRRYESGRHVRGVDATGTIRRVQALSWMGWTRQQVADRVGCTPGHLVASNGERVSVRLARAVAGVFEELHMVRGPSTQAAAQARAREYAPPLAWDEDTIDDPDASPDYGDRAPRRDVVLDAVELMRLGVDEAEAARRLGIKRASLVRARTRYRKEAA